MLSKIKKYRHGFIIAIYFVAYLILFGYLEQRPVRAYHVVHTVFDDMIPFCEIFIIPYLLWFPYVVMTVVYFLFRNKNKKEYFRSALELIRMIDNVFSEETDKQNEADRQFGGM